MPTLQALILALFSDLATPGHLAKSSVLKFLVVLPKETPAAADSTS